MNLNKTISWRCTVFENSFEVGNTGSDQCNASFVFWLIAEGISVIFFKCNYIVVIMIMHKDVIQIDTCYLNKYV